MSVADRVGLKQLRPVRHGTGPLNIHPYFGRVDPALAQALIREYSRTGDYVLDPFCGSGTVLHEALRAGRSAIGWDSSPLAIGISLAKLCTPSAEETDAAFEFQRHISRWSSAVPRRRQILSSLPVPPMPRVQRVEYWFTDIALRELAFLRAELLRLGDAMPPVTRLLAWLAFSRIVTPASNQQGESSYRRVEKTHSEGDVVALYVDALQKIATGTSSLSPVLGPRNSTKLSLHGGGFRWSEVSLDVICTDARCCRPGTPTADLVVSSPPYLMSWDYGLYHKFRFYWLGWDLDSYEDTEIGRHLRRRKDDVERYTDDMTAAFHGLGQALKATARVALVNAPSVVYGELVDTNTILANAAAAAGWQLEYCEPSLLLTGPHHGMYASLKPRNAHAPGARGKQEHVLLFRRAAS